MSVVAEQSLSVVETDASNNTAIIRYLVTCICSGESYNSNTQTGHFAIDGEAYTNSYTLPKNTTTVVFDKYVTVSNASGRTISASYSFPTTPSGGTKTDSDSVTIPVLVQAPTIHSLTVSSKTINSITCSFTCTKADAWYYKLSTQSTYTTGSTTGVTSGNFTIRNLQPNTTYTVNFIARNFVDRSIPTYLDSTKSTSGTTYQKGLISSVSDFEHGNGTIVVTTNPSGSALNLVMKIGNTEILNKTVQTGNNQINFTDEELDQIYKLYGSSNQLTATFILKTANNSNYTDTKTATITLIGNQKTAHVSQGRAKVYVGVNGSVKKAVVWVGNNGRKRCI